MSVKKKLYLGFSVVLLLFVVVAATNLTVQSRVSQQQTEVSKLQAARIAAENLLYLTMTVSSTGAYYLLSNSQQDSDTYYQTYTKNIQDVQEEFARVKQMTSDPDSHRYLAAAQDEFGKYINGNDTAFMIYKVSIKLAEDGKTLEKDPQGVMQAQKQYFSVQREPVFDNLTKYTNALGMLMAQNQARMESLQNLAGLINIILTLIAIIIGSLIIFLISNRLTKALTLLLDASAAIADGKLTLQVPGQSRDELGELAKAFNKMSGDLNRLVKEVIDTASSLGSAGEELSASAQEASAASEHVAQMIVRLETGAVNQAKSLEEAREAINYLAASSQQVAENANYVSQSSAKAAQAAETGAVQAENAVREIGEIREITVQTASAVMLLGEQSRQIGQIVDVIKGIADQTNLLALNAAIEAARAGEHGRGFAVVAEEVKKLAEQSSASAQQIETLISNIQSETERAVQAMEKGSKEVAIGVETVNSTVTAFRMIVSEINGVVDQMQQASLAARQIANGISQVSKSADSISLIAGQTEISAQEVSAASEEQFATIEAVSKSAGELAKLGESLMSLVIKFEV